MGMEVYTDRELAAINYQKQGSYDDKPIDVVGRDLFHRKLIGTGLEVTFFDGSRVDPTITNVSGNALPATESFTLQKVYLRILATGAVATPNGLVQAIYNYLSQGLLTVGVDNKSPWVEIPGAMFIPSVAVSADNAALTGVKAGEFFTDAEFELPIPKVIGEKVGFYGKFKTSVAPHAILNSASVQIQIVLRGITCRGR